VAGCGRDILHTSKGATYAAAARGDIKTIRIGRLLKVPTSWLRATLGIDEQAV
jgi:hypothetical protein